MFKHDPEGFELFKKAFDEQGCGRYVQIFGVKNSHRFIRRETLPVDYHILTQPIALKNNTNNLFNAVCSVITRSFAAKTLQLGQRPYFKSGELMCRVNKISTQWMRGQFQLPKMIIAATTLAMGWAVSSAKQDTTHNT